MIKYFKTIDNRIEEIENFQKDCWINITHPDDEELEELVLKHDVPADFLIDSTDIDERSRVEREDDYNLVILRIPFASKSENDIPFTTIPLGIIFNEKLFISVCNKNNELISEFTRKRVKFKSFSTSKHIRFVLEIFKRTAVLYLQYLKEINRRFTAIEDSLHESMNNNKLIELQELERCLIYFSTSLKSNEITFEKFNKTKNIILNAEEREIFDDILIEHKQALEMAIVYDNILSKMIQSFSSIISNNLNITVKFLSAITIILMLPTLITSMYGMNVKLPFQEHPLGFYFVIGVSVILTILSVYIFIKKKWF